MALPLDQSIQRFISNDERMNTFANGNSAATYTTNTGEVVPSIQKFLSDKSAEVDANLNLSSPLPIGDVTPNSGAFTSLSATGLAVTGALSAMGALTTAGLKEDAAGNLGLGVTPSAWSQGKAIEVGATGYGLWNGTVSIYSVANTYFNSGFKYAITGIAASHYYQYQGAHVWSTAPSGTAGDTVTFAPLFQTAATAVATGANGSESVLSINKESTTNRSINAAGTINASGADYAEYERNNGLTIAKGQIVGFKADGTLTMTYSEAVRFGIKSTNPCIVGGDTWGTESEVGQRPEQPQFVAPEYTGSAKPELLPEDATDEQVSAHSSAMFTYNMDQAQHAANVELAQNLFDTATYPAYESALASFEAVLEAARVQVDRVAYSGKVPVNVLGANPGDYIVASSSSGDIVGSVIADPTFAQYKKAVGRVNKILPDGRAEVAVIVH